MILKSGRHAVNLHSPRSTVDGPPEQKERELETGRLTQRAVRSLLEGRRDADFLVKRARAAVAALEPGAPQQALRRVMAALDAPLDREALSAALASYGGMLERRRDAGNAVGPFETALRVRPGSAPLLLHAARANRKAGHRERAMALYRRVRKRGDARLARFAEIGQALLADAPDDALGAILRASESAGDAEAAAVALEERARLRQRSGRLADAVDDLVRAGLRYDHRGDRLRVARSLGDLLVAAGSLDAAREALWTAAQLAGPTDLADVAGRLRSIAREQGDEVGQRRWRPVCPSPLVDPMVAGQAGSPSAGFVDVIRGWRESLLGS